MIFVYLMSQKKGVIVYPLSTMKASFRGLFDPVKERLSKARGRIEPESSKKIELHSNCSVYYDMAPS